MTQISLDFAETPDGQKMLGEADWIEAVDDSEDFRESLGEHEMARSPRSGSSSCQIKQAEIMVDSSRPDDIQRARAAVRKARHR